MPRLIEVQDPEGAAPGFELEAGDILRFNATGGHVQSGPDVVELLGAYLGALSVDGGQVLTPMGPPNAVLFRAIAPGRATIDVVTGDPFHGPQTTTLTIHVPIHLPGAIS